MTKRLTLIVLVLLVPSVASARFSPDDRRLSSLIARVRAAVSCDGVTRDVLRTICPMLRLAGPGPSAIPPTLQPASALVGITVFFSHKSPNVRLAVLGRLSSSALALRTEGRGQFARITALKGSNQRENIEMAMIGAQLGAVLKRLGDRKPSYSAGLTGFLASLAKRATYALRSARDRAARNGYSLFVSPTSQMSSRLYLLRGALQNPARLLLIAVEFAQDGEYVSFYPVF